MTWRALWVHLVGDLGELQDLRKARKMAADERARAERDQLARAHQANKSLEDTGTRFDEVLRQAARGSDD